MILRTKEKKRIIVTLLLITAISAPFITERYVSRLATMKSTESLDVSATMRLILWQAGLKIFRDNLIFGTGFLSFPFEKMRYEGEFYDLDPDYRESIFRRQDPRVTHNTYIQVLSDSGLFAAVPFYLLIIGTFLSNRRVRKMVPRNNESKDMLDLLSAIESGVIGFCVCLFFINGIGFVFLPVQIVVCSIIREFVVQGPGKLAVTP
jgi:O-antigen ligase